MLPSDTYSQPNAADPVLEERTVLDIVVAMACVALQSPGLMRRVGKPVSMCLTTTSC
jgi:hypothetical protein